MKTKEGWSAEADALRRHAEEELARSPSAAVRPAPQADLERLVHELQVHQIELETQNEELREARRAIEAGLERYMDLYDLAPIGYLTLDREGTVQAANLTVATLLGVARAHLLGRRLASFISGDTRPLFDAFLRQVFATPAKCVCEVMLAHASAPPVYARLEAGLSADGQACRTAVLDITERKQAEQARATLEEQLREARELESIGRLAGGMAHDLNNLLTPILGYSEMLLAETAHADSRYADLEHILNAAQRARDLVAQLLAFGRKQLLELRRVDLRQVLTSFESALRRVLPANIRLDLRLPDRLGSVRADARQIVQVLTSLATNAQEAMPQGGALALRLADVLLDHADLAAHAEVTPGPYVLLTVSDDGCGMDAATQAHLFEPFFSTKGLGRGLGLSAVYGIVKQHGGHIWVDSAPGEGTTWRIYLPRDSEGATAPPHATSALGALCGAETVLLVEDDAQLRAMLGFMLEGQGYHVVAAEGAQECLAMCDARRGPTHLGPIHLLLTDVEMPDMRGPELHQRLQPSCPGLKALYMADDAADGLAQRGVLEEGAHLLRKPFAPQALVAKVREVLDSAWP